MTTTQDHEHLHHLIDRLSPAQVHRLRLITTGDAELSRVDRDIEETRYELDEQEEEGELLPPSFPALCGCVSAPSDFAERHHDHTGVAAALITAVPASV